MFTPTHGTIAIHTFRTVSKYHTTPILSTAFFDFLISWCGPFPDPADGLVDGVREAEMAGKAL